MQFVQKEDFELNERKNFQYFGTFLNIFPVFIRDETFTFTVQKQSLTCTVCCLFWTCTFLFHDMIYNVHNYINQMLTFHPDWIADVFLLMPCIQSTIK